MIQAQFLHLHVSLYSSVPRAITVSNERKREKKIPLCVNFSVGVRFRVAFFCYLIYRGADKCLPRPGRKLANVSVRMV